MCSCQRCIYINHITLQPSALLPQLADFNFDGYTDVLLVSHDGIWAWAQVRRCALLQLSLLCISAEVLAERGNAVCLLSQRTSPRDCLRALCDAVLSLIPPNRTPLQSRRCATPARCPSPHSWLLSWSSWRPCL